MTAATRLLPSIRIMYPGRKAAGRPKGAAPRLSDTEREAIEAGDVWWDADLFTGNPDWAKLLAFAPARLSDEEQQFLAGPVEDLCRMVNDWRINRELHDLP